MANPEATLRLLDPDVEELSWGWAAQQGGTTANNPRHRSIAPVVAKSRRRHN